MGTEKVSAMLKGGTTSFGVVLTRELEVLAIVRRGGGGAQKGVGGYKKFHPVFGVGGGGAKRFGPPIFRFCSPPPPLP